MRSFRKRQTIFIRREKESGWVNSKGKGGNGKKWESKRVPRSILRNVNRIRREGGKGRKGNRECAIEVDGIE